MKVSLNKANKIRNSLETLEIPIPMTSVFRTDQVPSKEDFNKTVKQIDESLKENLEKFGLLTALRNQIQEANMKFGASTKIGEIASLERVLKWSMNVLNSLQRAGSSFEDVVADIKHKEEVAKRDPSLSRGPIRVSASLLPADFNSAWQESIKEVKLSLEEAKERRNEINHSSIIELPENLVMFLRKHSLLKA